MVEVLDGGSFCTWNSNSVPPLAVGEVSFQRISTARAGYMKRLCFYFMTSLFLRNSGSFLGLCYLMGDFFIASWSMGIPLGFAFCHPYFCRFLLTWRRTIVKSLLHTQHVLERGTCDQASFHNNCASAIFMSVHGQTKRGQYVMG